MKRSKSFIGLVMVAIMLLLSSSRCMGQDQQDDEAKAGARTARELKKQQWLKQRKADQAKEAALKAHMKHQTKAVRKRMKRDARKAEKNNNAGAE